MPKKITPVTVYCRSTGEAQLLANRNTDSRALLTGAGTLSFHRLIAQHGAGEFTTLYVPVALKDTFRPPVGGEVRHEEI